MQYMTNFEAKNYTENNTTKTQKEIDTTEIEKSLENAKNTTKEWNKEQEESSKEADAQMEVELANLDFNSVEWKKDFFTILNKVYNNWEINYLDRSIIQNLSNNSLDIQDYKTFITSQKLKSTLVYDLVEWYDRNWKISINEMRSIQTALNQNYDNPLIVFWNIFWSEHNLDYLMWSIYNKVSQWIWSDLPDFFEDKIRKYSDQTSLNQYDAIWKNIALEYSDQEISYITQIAKEKWFDLSNFKQKEFPLDYWEVFSMIIRKWLDSHNKKEA